MVLSNLEPKSVFRFFEELCRIPHGSGNTAAASAWAEAFARERGLRCRRDEAGNVVIWKAASAGYEDHPAVMLQGHLDMVCVAGPGVAHDFTRDPLELEVDGGWVRAKGTTLGGDDGIAVAMVMALLDDGAVPHPPLEAVLTVDEEVGMLGATALDGSDLRARYLLNIDSEEEGVLTVGCAGGARCDLTGTFPAAPGGGVVCTLTVSGLQGGHSGVDINKGRANANKLLAEGLDQLEDLSFKEPKIPYVQQKIDLGFLLNDLGQLFKPALVIHRPTAQQFLHSLGAISVDIGPVKTVFPVPGFISEAVGDLPVNILLLVPPDPMELLGVDAGVG